MVALLLAAAAAFCAGETPAATHLAEYSMRPPEVPNPSLAGPRALSLPASAAPTPSEPAAAVPKVEGGPDIALVLPLQSADYGRAAEAVRDGFLAAAEADGAKDRVRVIAHGDGGVLDGFSTARSIGARVVVGPIVRDDLRTIATTNPPLPITIALNQLDEGAKLPDQVYTFALAIESDARVLARKAREDGVQSIAVIGGSTPLMRRFATAFVGEWLLAGGDAPRSFAFEPTPDGLGALRRELAKSTAAAALIAVDGPDAALARTFAPRVPAYTNALIPLDQGVPALRDLEDVQLVDVPWLVTPDAPALASLPRREFGSAALNRLYALGLDSFRVARGFVGGVPRRFELEGATGRITLGGGHALSRLGQLAVVRGGQVVPLTDGR